MEVSRRRPPLRGGLYELLTLQLARECERVRAIVAAVGRLPQGLAGAQDEGNLEGCGGQGMETMWWGG